MVERLGNMGKRWAKVTSKIRQQGPAKSMADYKMSVRIMEMVVFALVIPILGIAFFPSDSLGLRSGFPWLVVGPVVFATRYGSAWGVACALLAALFIKLPWIALATQAAASELTFLGIGLCVLCLMIGEISSSVRARVIKAEAQSAYLRERLDLFSTDYHVLKVSHAQLEESLAGQRLSLREALQSVRPLIGSGPEGLQAGKDLMAVVAQFCSVQIAGLYMVNERNQIMPAALAKQGDMGELSLLDPLLNLALEKKQLVNVKLDRIADGQLENNLLAVVPLVDSDSTVHGVLAIKDMHFMAFQQKNLDLLALLGSYLGKLLSQYEGGEQTPAAKFISELKTTVQFASHAAVPSMLVSLQFESDTTSLQVADLIAASIRSLDSALVLESNDQHHVLGLVFPLMTENGIQAFLLRIQTFIEEHSGTQLGHVLLDCQFKSVSKKSTLIECLQFLSVHAQDSALAFTPKSIRGQRAA